MTRRGVHFIGPSSEGGHLNRWHVLVSTINEEGK